MVSSHAVTLLDMEWSFLFWTTSWRRLAYLVEQVSSSCLQEQSDAQNGLGIMTRSWLISTSALNRLHLSLNDQE